MFRKSMSVLVILILASLVFGPLGAAKAQEPAPAACPPYEPALMRDKGFMQSLPPECAKDYQKVILNGSDQQVGGDVTPQAIGGPDAFGYTWDDSVPFNWVDATNGIDTGLSGDSWGNATGPITLPFPFKYYEDIYSQVYIAASGFLSFTDYGYWPQQQNPMPSIDIPNNIIAPFWTIINLANSGPSNRVYYKSGGTAPNRYFVVEWYDVKGGTVLDSSGGDETYRFEVILYENGDILFQYHTMTYFDWRFYASIGVEDIDGNGLGYMDWNNYWSRLPISSKSVRFYRPAPAARIKITPTEQGGFATAGTTASFSVDVLNTGELGSDTYDLTVSSTWPVTFYAANGITPLTDTDTDGAVDTGPIPQAGTQTIIAKVTPPVGAVLGNSNTANITACSSLNNSTCKPAVLQSAIPASFAQIFVDGADGAMSFEMMWPENQVVKKATPDWQYGFETAMAPAPNGNFIYAWSNGRCLDGPCSIYVNEIEYTLLDRFGNTVRAVSKLVDHSSATIRTNDYSPSVAVAPNGTIGITWLHYLFNTSTSQNNYNIYFATLDAAGNLLTGPTNVTNNAVWGTFSDLNIPRFHSPAIAASDDNRFTLSWQKYITLPSYIANIWYEVRDTAGTGIFTSTALTSDNASYSPKLNSLTGGKVILTWNSDAPPVYGVTKYSVVNSSGAVLNAATTLEVSNVYETPDAVQLPNGKVAVAWAVDTGIQYSILNSSYIIENGPNSASNPSLTHNNGYLSVTTDASSRVIMTWLEDALSPKKLFYALGDSIGTFITPPMIYKSSSSWVESSYNGQGNVSVPPSGSISGTVKDASGNPITGASMTVSALREDGTLLTNVSTDPADGTYVLLGMPLGVNIKLSAGDYNFPPVHGKEYYPESALLSAATAFNLSPGTPSYSNVDFTLPPAGRPSPAFEHLTFNVRAGRVLSNPLIRKAIAYGTDRERMLKAFLGNNEYGVVLNSLIAPAYWSQPAYSQVSIYPYNPAQAIAILDAAGITDHNGNGIRDIGGNDIILDFKTTQAAHRYASSAIFAENMAAIGLQVNVTNIPANEFFSEDPAVSPLLSGNFDIVEFAWVNDILSVDDAFPSSFYQTGNFQNYGGYSNTTVDAEYNAAFAATSRANMLPHVLAYYAATTDDMPSLPLFTREDALLVDTLSGTNVLADLSSTGVTVLYQNAAAGGRTGALASVINPGDLPAGKSLVALYEIGSNVTMFAGTGATVCVNYSDAGLTPAQENNLQLYHLTMTDARAWTNIFTSRDTTANKVCGFTTSFSTFAVLYTTDTTAPTVVSSLRADVDPNSAMSVNFTVTFSEPVTGVDATDFSLTSSGVLGPAVSGVSGSGSVYTVAVNTGSGSGTIRLDLTDNNTIVDAVSNPLGGAGVGDGDFVTGEAYTITKTWVFGDTPNTYWANSFIERLYNAGITSGCSTVPLNYCPDNTVSRAQMAIFLLKGIHGSGYVPPVVGAGTGFADVPADYWAARWIKQLAVEGITGGCGSGNYCPEDNVSRAQMAVFLLRSKHGAGYVPPAATGLFTDVPVGYWARNWIEQLAVEGITGGCGAGIYCPDNTVTRAQMAIFLVRTFNLP